MDLKMDSKKIAILNAQLQNTNKALVTILEEALAAAKAGKLNVFLGAFGKLTVEPDGMNIEVQTSVSYAGSSYCFEQMALEVLKGASECSATAGPLEGAEDAGMIPAKLN